MQRQGHGRYILQDALPSVYHGPTLSIVLAPALETGPRRAVPLPEVASSSCEDDSWKDGMTNHAGFLKSEESRSA
jgi:hypothetical protein